MSEPSRQITFRDSDPGRGGVSKRLIAGAAIAGVVGGVYLRGAIDNYGFGQETTELPSPSASVAQLEQLDTALFLQADVADRTVLESRGQVCFPGIGCQDIPVSSHEMSVTVRGQLQFGYHGDAITLSGETDERGEPFLQITIGNAEEDGESVPAVFAQLADSSMRVGGGSDLFQVFDSEGRNLVTDLAYDISAENVRETCSQAIAEAGNGKAIVTALGEQVLNGVSRAVVLIEEELPGEAAVIREMLRNPAHVIVQGGNLEIDARGMYEVGQEVKFDNAYVTIGAPEGCQFSESATSTLAELIQRESVVYVNGQPNLSD